LSGTKTISPDPVLTVFRLHENADGGGYLLQMDPGLPARCLPVQSPARGMAGKPEKF